MPDGVQLQWPPFMSVPLTSYLSPLTCDKADTLKE